MHIGYIIYCTWCSNIFDYFLLWIDSLELEDYWPLIIVLFRFTSIRSFFEECQNKFAIALIPEQYLTLDETVYPMRNPISFRIYNKNKPNKYGMLYKSLNAVIYPYTYQSHAYCSTPLGTPTSHFVKGTENYVHYLIERVQVSLTLLHIPYSMQNVQ